MNKFCSSIYIKNSIIKLKQYDLAHYIAANLILKNKDKQDLIDVENFILTGTIEQIKYYYDKLGEGNIIQKEKFQNIILFY